MKKEFKHFDDPDSDTHPVWQGLGYIAFFALVMFLGTCIMALQPV